MNERPTTGFIRKKLSYREPTELRTVNDIESEYWTLLLFYANVPEEGMKLIKTSSKSLKDLAYPTFSAFIKQAKTYYDSAKSLHHRAASLNYYYCFLNLAKAAIVCNTPRLYKKDFLHGLSSKHNNKSTGLFERTSRVFTGISQDGDYNTFDQLYQLSVGDALPNHTVLKVSNLLSYCSEATHQNSLAAGALTKQLPAFYAIRVNAVTGSPPQFWPLLAIHGSGLINPYRSFARKLSSKFEWVTLSSQAAREIFNVYAVEHYKLMYYQSREVFIEHANTDIYKVSKNKVFEAIGNYMYPVYYNDPHDFLLNLPLRKNLLRPMNECLAIYVLTHHLSELVRYHPQYLEKLLSSKEAWVLESIVDTSPSMFLRGIIPLITQTDYRITSRQ